MQRPQNESITFDCPNADLLSVSDRVALVQLALQMVEREEAYAGDNLQGTLMARRLLNEGFIQEYTKLAKGGKRVFVGYSLTYKGSTAVGEVGRLLYYLSGIQD